MTTYTLTVPEIVRAARKYTQIRTQAVNTDTEHQLSMETYLRENHEPNI